MFPFQTHGLRIYFKETDVSHGSSRIEVNIIYSKDRVNFEVSMTTTKWLLSGAYPKRRFSLERHVGRPGHKGVHLQLNYHMVENPKNIGSIHIGLDISSSEEMLDIAQGFLYSLYEMIGEMDEEFITIRDRMFREELIMDLASKKIFFDNKVNDCIKGKDIEIRSIEGKTYHLTEKEFRSFIEETKELIPLFG